MVQRSGLWDRRYLHVALPALSTDRLLRQARRTTSAAPHEGEPRPLVTVTRAAGALRLAAVDRIARGHGLRPGLGLAQAQAMIPDLDVRPHDPQADARLLESLADWADRWTPLVALAPPDGLNLDITGVAHLFGGEAAMVADLMGRLVHQGFVTATAIAPTPGAAWALARYGGRQHIIEAELADVLAPLPVAALRLPDEMVAGLARAGLKTIGDLVCRPRAPLVARFGPLLLERLDQALGHDDEPISPRRPAPPAVVERTFAEPIVREDDIAAVVLDLAGALTRDLAERGEGVMRAALDVFRVDGAVRHLDVGLAEPGRDPQALHALFRLKLGALEDPLDPGFGFDLVRLAAVATGPLPARDTPLPTLDPIAGDREARHRRLTRLGDRLVARFGDEAVLRPQVMDAHLPERAGVLVPLHRTATASPPAPSPSPPSPPGLGPLRPLRLFEPPEPVEIVAEVPDGPPLRLRWRRRSLKVVAAEGPERLLATWWPGGVGPPSDPRPRDYFRIVDEGGQRLWIFRDGLFGAADERPPRWFVHGVFA